MIVNVCPAATSKAPPDRFWNLLSDPARFGEWTDASFMRAEPPGPVAKGQVIHLAAPAFGRSWPLTMRVREVDPERRWIEVFVDLPFGVENRERIALMPAQDGGTLVRLN